MSALRQSAESVATAPIAGTTVSGAAMLTGWGSELLGIAPTVVNMFTGFCGAVLALVMAFTTWKKYKREQIKDDLIIAHMRQKDD